MNSYTVSAICIRPQCAIIRVANIRRFIYLFFRDRINHGDTTGRGRGLGERGRGSTTAYRRCARGAAVRRNGHAAGRGEAPFYDRASQKSGMFVLPRGGGECLTSGVTLRVGFAGRARPPNLPPRPSMGIESHARSCFVVRIILSSYDINIRTAADV